MFATTHLRLAAAALGVAMVFGPVQAAHACNGSEVFLEDAFDDNLTGWEQGPTAQIADGAMQLSADPNFNFTLLLSQFFFGDLDLCVDATFGNSKSTMQMGVVFWAEDYSNNHLVALDNQGGVSVYRERDNEWILLAQAGNAGVNTSANQANQLRVRLEGNVATVFVNGTEVRKFRSQKPSGDSNIGFLVASFGEQASARFDNLRITSTD